MINGEIGTLRFTEIVTHTIHSAKKTRICKYVSVIRSTTDKKQNESLISSGSDSCSDRFEMLFETQALI